jgi:dTMP kinase
MSGVFITLEGGEGAGKSTQAGQLHEWLLSLGESAIVTREPGGTPQAEAVRSLLVNGEVDCWTPEAEALLNYAARDSHLNAVIRPALAQSVNVVCDRFMDSTRAYQHHAGGCPVSLVDTLEGMIVGKTIPTLTFIFDLDPEVGLHRARARSEKEGDRFERKGLEFHQRLRQGFLQIARANPARCKILDAGMPVGTIAQEIKRLVTVMFND